MTNREKFKSIFGVYAEEFWAYPKDKMLDWLQYDVPDTNVGKWIPVSSGNLPDEGVNVITVVAFREWMEYKLNHIIDKESREWYWDHVVAWMPIEPWEGG